MIFRKKDKSVKHWTKTIMELRVEEQREVTIEFVDCGLQVTGTIVPVSVAELKEVNVYEF